MATDLQTGLTHEQVRDRIDRGQSNRISAGRGLTEGDIILRHVLTFFNLIFVLLALVLALCGSSIKNMTFLIVVVINTVISCVQEIRAKRAVDRLTLVSTPQVAVLRQGQPCLLPAEQLVLGDLVTVASGCQVCADGVLRSGWVQTDESLITGEADPVPKKPGDLLQSGSVVVAGSGVVELTQVGDAAFAARLTAEAKKDPKAARSEMMHALNRLIQFIIIGLIPIGIALFLHQFRALELSLTASTEATVAALVGMIPEGLFLLTSIALAASSLKLARQQVLVQDLNCIETLARVDVLCVDKTGTITEPAMELTDVIPLTDVPVEPILQALYGGQRPENDTAAAISSRFPGESDWECTGRVPFTSQTKFTAAYFPEHGCYLAGAPEILLKDRYSSLQALAEPHIISGCRVLLLAGFAGALPQKAPDPNGLTPLALLVLRNRIRTGAADTFSYFARQGVQIKILSGDNPQTVSAVAMQVGIQNAQAWLDASCLETQEDFLRAAQKYTVFGRVTPDQKKQLILALKKLGHTVAMTGDGVNDLLAMRQADCSIAMASGAQAASQVAKLVLLNSDFTALPQIVGEGRRVINNIQRAAALFLVKNIFSLGLALLSMLTGLAYPFAPFHLTLISALTIGMPSFFLAMEPNYERVRGKFLPTVLRQALPGGLTNIAVVMIAQIFMFRFSLPMADIRSVCTAMLAVVGMLVLFKVSQPFDRFRLVLWLVIGGALAGGFLLLPGLFDLYITQSASLLVLAFMTLCALAVFLALQGLFRLLDRYLRR